MLTNCHASEVFGSEHKENQGAVVFKLGAEAGNRPAPNTSLARGRCKCKLSLSTRFGNRDEDD